MMELYHRNDIELYHRNDIELLMIIQCCLYIFKKSISKIWNISDEKDHEQQLLWKYLNRHL